MPFRVTTFCGRFVIKSLFKIRCAGLLLMTGAADAAAAQRFSANGIGSHKANRLRNNVKKM